MKGDEFLEPAMNPFSSVSFCLLSDCIENQY